MNLKAFFSPPALRDPPPTALYNEAMPQSPIDALITAADRALRAVFAPGQAGRAPAAAPPAALPADPLTEAERRLSASLMRVNHAGEVAAQALYHGQAMVARTPQTRSLLLNAAREEADHLAWCEQRLQELGARPSLLNPLWYAGSFAIGALSASFGDRASLGFVAETERQVEGHLDSHLAQLPASDTRSRQILEAMRHDEIEHGAEARDAGAAELPGPAKAAMRHTSRVMTLTSYWI